MSTMGTCILLLGSAIIASGDEPSSGCHAKPQKLAVHFGANEAADKGIDGRGGKPKRKRKSKITIGRETTFVTEPIGPDGYIDYEAALNKLMSKGVTPANNAAVLLWKAFGPHPEGTIMPAEFFRLLGIQALPEKGDYQVDLSRYLKKNLEIGPRNRYQIVFDQLGHSGQRPWMANDYPVIAGWLKANDKPLALVVQATKRPHYYLPLLSRKTKDGSASLISALLPGVQNCREFAGALTSRAMLRIGQKKYDDAWQDLLACHRLGRLVARGGTLIEALVGIAIDGVASRADLAFLDQAKLSAKRLKVYLRDLQQLPAMPTIVDKLNFAERFMLLETFMMIDRHGLKYLERMAGDSKSQGPNPLYDRLLDGIDWDPGLRNANRWYDRLIATLREKNRLTREQKLAEITVELKALKKKAVKQGGLSLTLLGGDKAAQLKGEAIGNVLISLLLPAASKVQNAADRAKQIHDNLTLAFALAWYQRDHGKYPKKLSLLAPNYLKQIPSDTFSGKAIHYLPNDKGYLLYSVGVNGKDEGGRGPDDQPRGDDVSVRMPQEVLPRS